MQAIKSLGISLEDYSDVVANICQETTGDMEQNDGTTDDHAVNLSSVSVYISGIKPGDGFRLTFLERRHFGAFWMISYPAFFLIKSLQAIKFLPQFIQAQMSSVYVSF